jgi:hypothetical protein
VIHGHGRLLCDHVLHNQLCMHVRFLCALLDLPYERHQHVPMVFLMDPMLYQDDLQLFCLEQLLVPKHQN